MAVAAGTLNNVGLIIGRKNNIGFNARNRAPITRRKGMKCNVLTATANSMLYDHSERSSSNKQLELFNFDDDDNNKITPEKMDQWIKDSVQEIVSNIGEAPFLVHIFSNGTLVKLEREQASPEIWETNKKNWSRGFCTSPDGVILVEELKNNEESNEATKKWGVVVQGKGMDCAACYILNTCRVQSTMGFATHFCLFRAQCFGEPVEMQMKKAWLQWR